MTEPATSPAASPILLNVTRHMASILRRLARAEARSANNAVAQARWFNVEHALTSVIDRETVSIDGLFDLADGEILVDAAHVLWQVWPQVDGEVWLAPFGSSNVFQVFRDPTYPLGYRTHAMEAETFPAMPVRPVGLVAS